MFVIKEIPKINKLIEQVKKNDFRGRLLAVDPGETTGLTIIDRRPDKIEIIFQDQLASWPLDKAVTGLDYIFDRLKPSLMVYEAYHVYSWRLQEHSFSKIPTIQIIGALRCIAIQRRVPDVEQTAQTGKAFWSDDKLKSFGCYVEGMKHARDSLRHALQFLVFGSPKEK